jgi:predicted membrane protein
MDGTFDLRDIYINNLEIDTGASDITLYLSEKSDLSTIDIDNGVSDIVVFIPDGVGVSLDYDGAIKDVDIEEDSWSKKDGYYYSPGYEESLKKTIILVDSGVGSIEFKFLDSDE